MSGNERRICTCWEGKSKEEEREIERGYRNGGG